MIRRCLRGSPEERVRPRSVLRRVGGPRHGESILAIVPGTVTSDAAESSDEAANGALPYGEVSVGGPLRPSLTRGSATDQLLRSGGPSARSRAPSDELEVVHVLGGRPSGVCLHEDALSAP